MSTFFLNRKTLAGKLKATRAPFTYINRIRLKGQFKKKIKACITRERTYTGEEQPGRNNVTAFIRLLPACIALIVFAALLPEAIKGDITPLVMVGLLSIAPGSTDPFSLQYNRRKAKKDE